MIRHASSEHMSVTGSGSDFDKADSRNSVRYYKSEVGTRSMAGTASADFKRRRSVAHTRRSAQLAKKARLRTKGENPKSSLGKFIFHHRFESFGGCVVLFNFVIMTMETHAAATSDDDLMDFVVIVNRVLLAYYTLECALRLYVMRWGFFLAGWNILDFVIVLTGMFGEFLEISKIGNSGIPQIAMLKALRMLRLTRLVRLLVAFRELYSLVAGIGRCMKTLLWASGLIFIVLNVWAILSVEFLDAKVRELASMHAYPACAWCPQAFSNIWVANLTWFQIISTADWSLIGRPLAEHFIWPYMFFVVNVFVVTWGLLNLIVAGLVDANIAARDDDVAAAADWAARGFQQAWASFAQMCTAMDVDGSGDISVDEFKRFWTGNSELQQHLTIMGVREKDVDELLNLMDDDGSGLLESNEFIEQFTTMRTMEVKTSIFFLKKYMKSMQEKLNAQSQLIQSMHKDLTQMRRPDTTDTVPRAKVEDQFLPRQTGDKRSTTVRGTVRRPTPDSNSGKPHVDMQTLPSGWYYFGAALPLEARAWCKAIDPIGEVLCSSKFPAEDCKSSTKRVTTFATDSQTWEPVPLSAHASQATRSTASSEVAFADISDIELHPKLPESFDLNAILGNSRVSAHAFDANVLLQSTNLASCSGSSSHESKFELDDPNDVAKLVTKETVFTTDCQKYERVPVNVHQEQATSVFPMPSEVNLDESKDPPSPIPVDFPSAEMFQPTEDAEQKIHG